MTFFNTSQRNNEWAKTGSAKNWILAVLCLPVLLVSACSDNDTPALQKTFAQDVSALATARITSAQVSREIEFDGVIEAVNRAVASAQTSGRIIELPFDVGDFVTKGAVIARFTDNEQQAALTSAKAQLEEARAIFNQADQQLTRITDVYKQGVVAKADFDKARAAQQSAKARIESANAAIDEARQRLSYTQVVAPYSGIVVRRLADVGATVSPGTPLLEGVSLEQLRVRVDIPQQHIDKLRLHNKARVLFSSGESVDASEMRIPPSAELATHTFSVLIQLPEGERKEPAFPGTLVKVAFVVGEQAQILVPAAAIAKRGEVNGVYVISSPQQALEFRYIRVGKTLENGNAIVLAGLAENETIALDPIAAAMAYKSQTFTHNPS